MGVAFRLCLPLSTPKRAGSTALPSPTVARSRSSRAADSGSGSPISCGASPTASIRTGHSHGSRSSMDARFIGSGTVRPIRTVAAIDAEIAELESSILALGAAVDDVDSRIDSDEFDAGRIEIRNMPKDRHGRFIDRTSTLNAATHITAARKRRAELASERAAMRREIAELRE